MILWWRTSRRQRLTQGIPLRTPAQLATIESTVQSSVDRALQSFSISANLPFMDATPPYSDTQPRRAGTATPLSLEDKILRGEFIDFTLLLPDSLTQPKVPELQLRLDDLSPGSLSSPLSMLRKRKPVIDTFHKWLDAYTTYMLVIVTGCPRCPIELLKYQQIISRAETQFQGSKRPVVGLGSSRLRTVDSTTFWIG